LRVEYLQTPITIDVASPRFSWALEHPQRGQGMTAYEIVVLNAGSGAKVWDSGKVSSNVTTNVAYGSSGSAATALTPDTDYQWTVTWYDNAGNPSTPATDTFSTALFANTDFLVSSLSLLTPSALASTLMAWATTRPGSMAS
jgi:alpha-L-rhamnosidase